MPKLINLDRMPSRTQRPDPATLPQWRTSRGSLRLLEGLLKYRYLTPRLAAYWIDHRWGRGGYQARHELTRLWQYHLVDRFYRPVEAGSGSSQYVYAATLKGAAAVLAPRELAEARKEIERRARQPLGWALVGNVLNGNVLQGKSLSDVKSTYRGK